MLVALRGTRHTESSGLGAAAGPGAREAPRPPTPCAPCSGDMTPPSGTYLYVWGTRRHPLGRPCVFSGHEATIQDGRVFGDTPPPSGTCLYIWGT